MADFAIAPVTVPSAPVAPAVARPGGLRPGGEGFAETLGRALRGVDELQHQAADAAVALASGERVDTAQTLLAVEKANVSFQFALQVRNKLLEAYQEIMRMPV